MKVSTVNSHLFFKNNKKVSLAFIKQQTSGVQK